MRARHVMLDHPSWLTDDEGTSRRVVRVGEVLWFVVATPSAHGFRLDLHLIQGTGTEPRIDRFDPAELHGRDELVCTLREDGPVLRLANPDPWDAVATSIIRQVIRAGQARKLYRALCAEHGEWVTTSWGTASLFPTARRVLGLPDEEFQRLGLAFKRAPLRAAAHAYLEFGQKWNEIDAQQLRMELQNIPRIGPWTASATVADLTNDYALYPYADLAVRTWAARLTPELSWPTDEPTFADVWHTMAGEQLSAWTVLTLAWGVRHAHGVAL